MMSLVRQVRPDMTASEALTAVELVRRSARANTLGPARGRGFSFLRLSTGGGVILASLDAERHIDDLTKIAATMHQGAPLERSASAGTCL